MNASERRFALLGIVSSLIGVLVGSGIGLWGQWLLIGANREALERTITFEREQVRANELKAAYARALTEGQKMLVAVERCGGATMAIVRKRKEGDRIKHTLEELQTREKEVCAPLDAAMLAHTEMRSEIALIGSLEVYHAVTDSHRKASLVVHEYGYPGPYEAAVGQLQKQTVDVVVPMRTDLAKNGRPWLALGEVNDDEKPPRAGPTSCSTWTPKSYASCSATRGPLSATSVSKRGNG